MDSSPHELGPRVDRDAVLTPLLRASSGSSMTRPGSDAASQGSQVKDQPAAHIARSTRKIGEDLPSVVTVVPERKADGPARPARADEAWGDAVDSDGDCKFEREPHENKLRIIVPGKTHILSRDWSRQRTARPSRREGRLRSERAGRRDQPSRRQSHDDGVPPLSRGGLIIWQNPENYVRLEIAADVQRGKVRPYVNFEYRNDGVLAFSQGLENGDGSNHLRLKRRGDEIHASFGPDGFRWTSFPPLTAQLSDRLNVGVTAINSSTKPLTAEFEGFDLLDRGPS